jgi:histone-lysine N-methyltransferase SETMAR
MITVFWDHEGVILVDVMLRGETINSHTYVRMLTELGKHFKQVRPYKNPTEILFQHDSECSHTSLETWEAITKFVWTMLPHPPYTPYLTPSDFHLFVAVKDSIRSTKFDTDVDVIHTVRTWLREQDKAWYP